MDNIVMINGVRTILTAAQTQKVLDALYGKMTKAPTTVKKAVKKRKGFFARRWTESETADINRIAALSGRDRSQAIRDFARQSGRTTHAVAVRVYKAAHTNALNTPEPEYSI